MNTRFTPEEYDIIRSRFKKSMFRKMSEYSRSVLLQKPVIFTYRDKSMDDMLEELILLRRELNYFGNNFNQAVHKLHTLDHIPEIKFWAEMSASTQQHLIKKVDEIRDSLNEIRRQCARR